MNKPIYIGELAKQTGLTVKAIRHYESLGLLTSPLRSSSGYRLYTSDDVERLRFIVGAKALGLSLGEIREILAFWGLGETPCEHVAALLEDKLAELDRRIARLVTFRDSLRAYKQQVDKTERSPGTPCKHIAGLAQGKWQLPELDADPLQGSRRLRSVIPTDPQTRPNW